MTDMTDEEIAERVQGGDTEAFGALIERYERKISRYAGKFLSDSEDARDLVQEVFIKAYVNIRSFDAKRKFSPWLYRIAHNEFVSALKRKDGEIVSFVDIDALLPHPSAKEAADDLANRRALRAKIESHLKELGAKYREAIVLYYFEELDYAEIADILRIPISTVGVRLRRAKAMLKKSLQEGGVTTSTDL